MKEFLKKMVPVTGSDHFPFRCQMCGACCRHVKESVPIDSLDAFRLARFLRNKDKRIRSMDDVLELYAEHVLLHEYGLYAEDSGGRGCLHLLKRESVYDP
mgnify:CR=1 FL=1